MYPKLTGPQFAQLVESIIYELNLPKEYFYKHSGITSANMSQWRNGIFAPSSKRYEQIRVACGRTPEEFETLIRIILRDTDIAKAAPEPVESRSKVDEFNSLFSSLSPAAQQLVLEQMQGLLKLQESAPAAPDPAEEK